MIRVDTSEISDLENQLRLFARKAYPFATKHTVNTAAFEARSESKVQIGSRMILRNTWTARSVQVNQARTLQVSRQYATVGALDDYLERQEFGGTVAKKGKVGHPIATSYSAGQGLKKKPRTRLPRKPNKLENIKLQNNKRVRGSKRKRNLVYIKEAARTGRKYVFLEMQKTEGIFKVIGGKKRPKIRMVHSLSKDVVRTPRNPWLAPAVDKTQPKIPGIYLKALKFQIERNRLFR